MSIRGRKKINIPQHVLAAIQMHCENPLTSESSINAIAKSSGFDPKLLYNRARDMGYHKFQYRILKKWDEKEIKIVEDNRQKHIRTIKYYLNKAGYDRTISAVKAYIIRNKIYWNNGDKLSVSQIAEGMGVTIHAVIGWIDKKLLEAEKTELKFLGEKAYLVKIKDLRKFIIKYKGSHDFRKANQCFIIDVLSGEME